MDLPKEDLVMADPILNEDMILAGLSPAASLDVANQLQEASCMAVVNAYDRQIKRASFIDLTNAAMTMTSNLGRLQVTARCRDMLEQDKLTKEQLADAIIRTIGYSKSARVELFKLTELVAKCPTSLDKVS